MEKYIEIFNLLNDIFKKSNIDSNIYSIGIIKNNSLNILYKDNYIYIFYNKDNKCEKYFRCGLYIESIISIMPFYFDNDKFLLIRENFNILKNNEKVRMLNKAWR